MSRSIMWIVVSMLVLSELWMGGSFAGAKDSAASLSIKEQVLKIEEARNEALQKGDVAALDRIYADDLVYTNAAGYVLTKSQHLADIKARKLRFTSFKHSNVEVHVHGNTGIVMGTSTSAVEYNGTASSSPRKYVNVYVRENGVWHCVAHTETPAHVETSSK